MKDHKLWLRWRNEAAFSGVCFDYGVMVWDDGDIDIAPQYLYDHAVAAEEIAQK